MAKRKHKIMRGLRDAVAYASGDKTKGRIMRLKVTRRKGRPKGTTRTAMRKRRLKEVKRALKTLKKLVPLLAA